MAKTTHIELGDDTLVRILFENRSLLILDKPAGWVLTPDVPVPGRSNLQIAVESSIRGGAFWARSRGLKFLRFVHRLDADTSGALLCAKHIGAMRPLSLLFAQRKVEKSYLAVTHGVPKEDRWVCQIPLGPDPEQHGRHRVDPDYGKQAETHFQVLQKNDRAALVLVRPVTGRTHQIRLHLLANRTPVAGDRMYAGANRKALLGLRAIRLEFTDPFDRKLIKVSAPITDFVRHYKFDPDLAAEQIKQVRFDPPRGSVEVEEDEEEEVTEAVPSSNQAARRPLTRRPDRPLPPPFRSGGRAPGRPDSVRGPRREETRREAPWRPEGVAAAPRPRPTIGRRPTDDQSRRRSGAPSRDPRGPAKPRSGRSNPGRPDRR